MSQPLVGAFSPGTEPSLRFGFALYTVEERRLLQVRARFLVRAPCEGTLCGRITSRGMVQISPFTQPAWHGQAGMFRLLGTGLAIFQIG